MLDAIDSARTDGVFGGTLAAPPAGQAAAADLLEACMEKAHALLETATPMSGEVATIYGALAKHHKARTRGVGRVARAGRWVLAAGSAACCA